MNYDKQTEALKLALEALENTTPIGFNMERDKQFFAAITAIREALAEQPAQQQSAERGEPVEYWTVADGWVSEQAEVPAAVWVEPDFWEHCNRVNCGTAYRLPAPGRQPLYTSPPASKPWVGLSTDEIYDMYNEPRSDAEMVEFARAIEAKLKEKNNG